MKQTIKIHVDKLQFPHMNEVYAILLDDVIKSHTHFEWMHTL